MSQHPALARSRTGVLVGDGIAGAALFVVTMASSLLIGQNDSAGPADIVTVGISTGIMAAAVAVRRLHPDWALGLAWASTVVHMAAGLDAGIIQVGVLVVLASASHFGSPLVVRLSGVSVVVGALLAVGYLIVIDSWLLRLLLSTAFSPAWLPYVVLVALVVLTLAVPWLIGLLARTLRLSREGRERATVAQAEAQRSREIAELQGARTTLARDVHDIVGHSLAVIIAQAESVRFRDVDDLQGIEAVRNTVSIIAETARRALGDVRNVLETTAPSGGEAVVSDSFVDRPGLDLDQLLHDVERSRPGMVVERDEEAPVPTGEASVALYRAVQELLTNALRHGDARAPLHVRVGASARAAAGDLEVVVENTAASRGGAEPAAHRAGTGLDGARARLAAVGGALETSEHEGRFRAIARVPVAEVPS